ncbi:AraC family transcriptional regulator [Pseudomonas fluorescens]|jgi:AraC family transcriptional regulator|uniref:helix-turn-helix domain-containing protein n=1 Tax=Pseudomonas TaxID=286 RepID=UPI000710E082|nr:MULTISPECIES: AraC family transcriptional regulator [Pseudomonas]OOQ44888.1 AraC family transcriptional regulator [Pseudomonas fluorescens]
MNAIHYSEYDCEASGNFLTEASLAKQGFDLRVEQAQWSCSGTALIETGNSCLIRLMLPASDQSKPNCGSFPSHGARQFQPLGKLLFIPHGTEFHLRHDACKQKALVCLFDPSALGALGSYRWNWKENVSEAMLDLQSGYLHASLQRLAEEVSNPGFASELQTECLLTSIALDLRREFIDAPVDAVVPSPDTEKLSPRQFNILRELLDTTSDEGHSLRHLAQACELPLRTLSSRCKNTTGMTLRQYAAQHRLRKAMALLADPRLLIKQVAYQAGFNNAAAFSAAFRKELGLTPEEFRHQRQR